MEIDLSEMYLKEKKKRKPQEQKKIIPPPSLEKPDPHKFTKLPDIKKKLSPDIANDPGKKEQSPTSKPVPKKEKSESNVKDDGDKSIPSPLFIGKKDTLEKEKEKPEIPQEIRNTFRKNEPEKTSDDNLQYSMNTYSWTFERYVENWAIDLQKWWKAPLDYAFGKVPDGGDIWIQVRLERSGRLMGYTVLQSNVTPEMELRVTQALIASLKRSPMPDAFPEETLVINWRFIYPAFRPDLDLRR